MIRSFRKLRCGEPVRLQKCRAPLRAVRSPFFWNGKHHMKRNVTFLGDGFTALVSFSGACLRPCFCSVLFFTRSIFLVSRSSREIERLIKTERISSASVQPASSQRRRKISFSSAVNVASTFSLRLIFIPSVSEWPPKRDLEKSAEFFSKAKPLRAQSGTQLCLSSFPV